MALPTASDRPIVCVGPGTGIAPLRALIQRRVKQGEMRTSFVTPFATRIPWLIGLGAGTSSGNTVYFGCRKEASDFLFKDDWSSWSEKGQVDFRVAFSRDQVCQPCLSVALEVETDTTLPFLRCRTTSATCST